MAEKIAENLPIIQLTSNSRDIRLRVEKSFLEQVKQLWESVRMTVFVIGSALTIFIAARNSITWYLQRFWGASGSYWQSKWEMIHDYFEGDNMLLAVSGSLIMVNGSFFLINLFFTILDLTGKPSFLLKYKIQPDKNCPVEVDKLLKALKLVFFNQFILGGAFLFFIINCMKWRGCSFGRELPTFHWVLFELVVYSIVEEILFYYSHRMFHSPLLYKHIHKIHHEWLSPIGVASIYAHPLEHLVANMFPAFMGPFIMGSHIATAIMWFTLAFITTSISHCGYHLPFLPSPEAHDFHHLKFINNFGMLGILDRLHGTDKLFRDSKAYQRHVLLLGLVPLSEQIPEDLKLTKKNKSFAGDAEDGDDGYRVGAMGKNGDMF